MTPGFNCVKLKRPASSVLALRFDPVSGADDRYSGIRNGGSAGIDHRAHNGAGGLSLGHQALRKRSQNTATHARRKRTRAGRLKLGMANYSVAFSDPQAPYCLRWMTNRLTIAISAN